LTIIFALLTVSAAFAKPVVLVALAQASVTTAPDGSVHLAPLEDSVSVAGGTIIRYTVSAKDVGSEPARHLALVGRIPAGTTYSDQSIHGSGGHAEFSLDGKTFAAHPVVVVRSASGAQTTVAADPAQYILIRWVKDTPLLAKASTAFSYDVIVK
jgi:hypothetical protein